MSEYSERAREAIQATTFPSKNSYTWFGELSPLLASRVRRALTARTARSYLLTIVQARLYQDFYLRGYASPGVWESVVTAPAGRAPFILMLSEANTGQGYWESGWEIHCVDGDSLAVARGGLQVRACSTDCSMGLGLSPTPGAEVKLRFPKEYLNISPGFYMAAGDHDLAVEKPDFLIRLYWNLTERGAVPFVQAGTGMMNEARLPFRLKVINDTSAFDRCDAGVIYLTKSDCANNLDLVSDLYRTVAPHLKAGVPAFTRWLAPGLGFAEDPLGDESFGQHRCRLLADGMIRAREAGQRSLSGRLQTVIDRFAEAGTALDLPYLNPGSTPEDLDWARTSGLHG